jgi:hypothetical protein
MFDSINKGWFHSERLDDRIEMVKLWRDNENEELEGYTGENHDNFLEMMEIISDLRANNEVESQIFQDELMSEGFERPVVLIIEDAIKEVSNEPYQDFVFVRRRTTSDELQELMDASVDLYLGNKSADNLESTINHLDQVNNLEDQSNLSQELFNRTYALTQYVTRVSYREAGGIENLKQNVRESANFTEEQIEAFFQPIENNLDDLQRYHVNYYVFGMVSLEISEMDEKLDAVLTSLHQEQ